MPITPLSATTAYATADDLIKRYDARLVGDMLLDIGARADAEAITSGAALPADSVTQFFLDDASGQVEAAVLVGEKYSPTDLQALTGVTRKFLIGLVCDLAFWGLARRREPGLELSEAEKMARGHLKALNQGSEIFGTVGHADAGLPSHAFVDQADIDQRDLATNQARRFFGQRGDSARQKWG